MDKDSSFILLQKCLPKHLLTRVFGFFAERRIPFLTPFIIRRFAKHYGVDMSLAKREDLMAYRTFNEFFTRPLKDSARPNQAEEGEWMCPVDGSISQLGAIENQKLFQAKNHHYDLDALFGGYSDAALPFSKGHFCTIYLSPKDYHRIHMPCAGQLKQMIHVPGKLYSVNPVTVAGVPNLFAINERVIAIFDTEQGPMAMVFVGATIVGSIETVWSGVVTPPSCRTPNYWTYDEEAPRFEQGDEIGRFKLGSTVIVLLGQEQISWASQWAAEKTVVMGEVMAKQQ